MGILQHLLIGVIVCSVCIVVEAQYKYPKPESNAQVDSQGGAPDAAHEPGRPYKFSYVTGNGKIDRLHRAESDGDTVTGEYHVLLPDNRKQIVRYTADWKNGYKADISYEPAGKILEKPHVLI